MIQRNSESNRDGLKATPPTQPYSARLLLVEDHTDLAEVTAEFLSEAGLDVRIAKSGKEALQIATTFRPNIVLCDMILPDMLGMEVAGALRRHPVTVGSLLIMHTAMSDIELTILEREMTIGEFNLFLSKPMTHEKIDRLWTALAAMRRATQ
jgi:CheY-like chemotaxis protein